MALVGGNATTLLWRRIVALLYDALLLAALWMITAMAVRVVGELTRMTDTRHLMQVALFFVGLAFFAWFWSHGGQTLGMRAWRIRVQGRDGAALSLSAATLRYVAGIVPVVAMLMAFPRIGAAAVVLLLAGYAPCPFANGRALNDLVAGSRLILLPKASAQLPQAP
jgi:uncharacterized RDD family membrane protein YckC